MSQQIARLLVSYGCLKVAFAEQNLSERLAHTVREADFHLTDETKWAYCAVATFLEDGWKSQAQYTVLLENCPFTLDELGRMVNSLVTGSRYDREHAERVGARWIGRGSWPTDLDRTAILFAVTCKSPE